MHRPMDESVNEVFPSAVRPHPAGPRRLAPLPADGLPHGLPDGFPDPARVDPAVLGALLARHGWRRRGGAAGRYSRWTPPGPSGGSTSLLVPDTTAFPDSEDLLAEALTALARSAAPSARDVLVALAVPSDEIRWWRDVPEPAAGTAGAAGWTGAEQLHGAARQILLAGALAVRGRAGYHGARHRRSPWPGHPRPGSPRAARHAPNPSSSPRGTCRPCAGREPATSATSRRWRFG